MEKYKQNQKSLNMFKHAIGVLVDLAEGPAVKFVSHRGFDALLCHHVYQGFCPECPQYKCRRRRL